MAPDDAPGPWVPPPPPGWVPPGGYAPGPPKPKAGDARTGPLPLHPMLLSDVLDGAFKLFKANARAVLTIAALFLVPIQAVASFLQRDAFSTGIFSSLDDPSTSRALNESLQESELVAALFAFAATVLVLPFVAGAISRVVASSYVGEQLEAGPALRAVGRRWVSIVGGWALVHLVEAAGIVLGAAVLVAGGVTDSTPLVVLGAVLLVAGLGWALVAMVLFVAVAPAIVVEELRAWPALKRSAALVRRRFWGVLGIALLGGLLASVLGQVLGAVPQVAAALAPSGAGWLLVALGGVLSSLVTTPLVAIISTLVYFDGRIRHEAFDLELIAAALARDTDLA